VLSRSFKFNDHISPVTLVKLVQEKFLALVQEARLDVDDLKGSTFRGVKAQGSEFPSIGEDVNTDDQDPISFGFRKPSVNLPHGQGDGFGAVFEPFLSPGIHAFLPVELRDRFQHV